MFESLSRSEQGDLGEARAIYELTRLGYIVSKPLRVHVSYDLVADDGKELYRVQVKTGRFKPRDTNTYQVGIMTTGGNTRNNTIKKFDRTKCDLLFVMTSDDRCWLIPTSELISDTSISVGGTANRFAQYQISGKILTHDKPVKRSRIQSSAIADKVDKRHKTPPFTKEELEALVWKYPTRTLAIRYNLSDNGLARWLKKWDIPKPPRGYWGFKPSVDHKDNDEIRSIIGV